MSKILKLLILSAMALLLTWNADTNDTVDMAGTQDSDLTLLIDQEVIQTEPWRNGVTIELIDKGEVLVNLEGRIVSDTFDEIKYCGSSMDGDVFAYRVGSLWGLMNNDGKVLIGPRYVEIAPFLIQYTRVMSSTGFGVIDTEGTEVLPCVYDGISLSDPDIAMLSVYSEDAAHSYVCFVHLISMKWSIEFEFAEPLDGEYARIIDKTGRVGLIDRNFNVFYNDDSVR